MCWTEFLRDFMTDANEVESIAQLPNKYCPIAKCGFSIHCWNYPIVYWSPNDVTLQSSTCWLSSSMSTNKFLSAVCLFIEFLIVHILNLNPNTECKSICKWPSGFIHFNSTVDATKCKITLIICPHCFLNYIL